MVRTSGDHRRDREATPFMAARWQREQCHEKWQAPELANDAVESTLCEMIAAVRQGQHENDLQCRRRNG